MFRGADLFRRMLGGQGSLQAHTNCNEWGTSDCSPAVSKMVQDPIVDRIGLVKAFLCHL